MNLVDAHVRQAMLDFYSIHPTRDHVLEHRFLTIGNGYEWFQRKVDGLYVLDSGCEPRNRTTIERPEYLDCDTPGYRESIAFELLKIEWVEKNLDVLCRGDAYVPVWKFPRPYPNCERYARIAEGQHPPVDQIHPDWRHAVRQFAERCMTYVRMEACWVDGDVEVLKRARPDLYEPYVVCKYASRAFMTPAERVEQARQNAEVMAMIEQIRKEAGA